MMESSFIQLAYVMAAATAIGMLALVLRQPLIVAFIAVGILVGPVDMGWVVRQRLNELASSLPVDTHEIHLGRPEIVLMETALSRNCDLVGVGRRGLSRVISILLGSVAHHIVHEAPCDVLVYRSEDFDFRLP